MRVTKLKSPSNFFKSEEQHHYLLRLNYNKILQVIRLSNSVSPPWMVNYTVDIDQLVPLQRVFKPPAN